MTASAAPEKLLTDTAWVRRLARHLVADADADDVAQEAALLALGTDRRPDSHAAGWLGGIVRNVARDRARAVRRRMARERSWASDPAVRQTADSGADVVMERLELQQRLTAIVLQLEEPYRTTVLLRYYEGLDASRIAERLGIPAGTVRWRLKRALDDLRDALDRTCGPREAWMGAMAPWLWTGRTALQSLARPGGLALVAAVTLGIGLAIFRAQSQSQAPSSSATIGTSSSPSSMPPPTPAPEQTMKREIAAASLSALVATTTPASPAAATSAPAQLQAVRRQQVPLGSGPVAGPPDALVTLVLFGGYECPFTAGAYQTIATLIAERPQDLRLQFVQAPLPFHARSLPAARAVLAAGEQGKYWPMHQRLFAGKASEGPKEGKKFFRRLGLEAGELEAHARALGLDVARFHADSAGAAVDQKLEIDKATVDSTQVRATPTTFINGRRVGGAIPAAQLASIIRDELAIAEQLVRQGVPRAAVYNQIVSNATGARPTTVPLVNARPASRANDDFESGTLAAWRTDNDGSGSWFVYRNGKTPPDPATTDPRFPFEMPEPPQGGFAAVTDMKGPGSRILFRDVELDGRYRLAATVFYASAGELASAASLDHESPTPVRQFRIDVLIPSAPIDSLDKEHILASVFATKAGDPQRRAPTPIAFDLSPWKGKTVRLRLASVDNRGPLRAGIDQVRFEPIRK